MGEKQATSGDLQVVVLGASGMLGSELVRQLSGRHGLSVRGTVRQRHVLPEAYLQEFGDYLISDVDVTDAAARRYVVQGADVVINAVGVVKQAADLDDHVATVELNSTLPHQLAAECHAAGARLIQISTDCVFSGRDGGYDESSVPDPIDFYGRSKLLGEVASPALTLRTSIIGHELNRHASLADWFLTQPQTELRGFRNAIYSGVTTTEFASMLANIVFPSPDLMGLYHVASEPISKFDLLTLLADAYGWCGEIRPDDSFRCNRSMSAKRLMVETKYRPPSWPEMIHAMYENRPSWAILPNIEESRS